MVVRVARSYKFLVSGTAVSEQEISSNAEVARSILVRLRKLPYGKKKGLSVRTIEKIEFAFDLPEGWLCITPAVAQGLDINVSDPIPISRAEGLRDQYPEASFREGSKALVLLAQNVPPDTAMRIAM